MDICDAKDLQHISSNLKAIAGLIGPGTSYGMLTENASDKLVPLEMTMDMVFNLIPKKYKGSLESVSGSYQTVTVLIEDLFGQMDKGAVYVPLSQLIHDLPEYCFRGLSKNELKQAIRIPDSYVFESFWN